MRRLVRSKSEIDTSPGPAVVAKIVRNDEEIARIVGAFWDVRFNNSQPSFGQDFDISSARQRDALKIAKCDSKMNIYATSDVKAHLDAHHIESTYVRVCGTESELVSTLVADLLFEVCKTPAPATVIIASTRIPDYVLNRLVVRGYHIILVTPHQPETALKVEWRQFSEDTSPAEVLATLQTENRSPLTPEDSYALANDSDDEVFWPTPQIHVPGRRFVSLFTPLPSPSKPTKRRAPQLAPSVRPPRVLVEETPDQTDASVNTGNRRGATKAVGLDGPKVGHLPSSGPYRPLPGKVLVEETPEQIDASANTGSRRGATSVEGDLGDPFKSSGPASPTRDNSFTRKLKRTAQGMAADSEDASDSVSRKAKKRKSNGEPSESASTDASASSASDGASKSASSDASESSSSASESSSSSASESTSSSASELETPTPRGPKQRTSFAPKSLQYTVIPEPVVLEPPAASPTVDVPDAGPHVDESADPGAESSTTRTSSDKPTQRQIDMLIAAKAALRDRQSQKLERRLSAATRSQSSSSSSTRRVNHMYKEFRRDRRRMMKGKGRASDAAEQEYDNRPVVTYSLAEVMKGVWERFQEENDRDAPLTSDPMEATDY